MLANVLEYEKFRIYMLKISEENLDIANVQRPFD